MFTQIKHFLSDESGQGMVEYGLILALVAIAVIVVLGLLGDSVKDTFQSVVDRLGGGETGSETGL